MVFCEVRHNKAEYEPITRHYISNLSQHYIAGWKRNCSARNSAFTNSIKFGIHLWKTLNVFRETLIMYTTEKQNFTKHNPKPLQIFLVPTLLRTGWTVADCLNYSRAMQSQDLGAKMVVGEGGVEEKLGGHISPPCQHVTIQYWKFSRMRYFVSVYS